MEDMKAKRKRLKKAIKQMYSVIRGFRYEYILPIEKDPPPEDLERLEHIRKDLFELLDEVKKMELELVVDPDEIERQLNR